MEWVAIWKFAKAFGLPIALALSLLGNWHLSGRANYWHDANVQCGKDREADKEAFKASAKKAADENKATVTATETKWKGVVAANEKTYEANLNDAYARIRAYSVRYTASATASGGASGPSVPATSGASGVGQGTGESTLVPSGGALVPVPQSDLYICADNTVKAQKWQELWNGLVEAWPKNENPK